MHRKRSSEALGRAAAYEPYRLNLRILLARFLEPLERLWRAAPQYARGLALVVPFMVPTLFYVGGGNVSSASTWASLQAKIRARATVDLEEDFSNGLAAWTGHDGWENSWRFDQTSFVQPGQLAIFKRSIPLANYRMEFLGQIVRRSISFVVRASGPQNYHAVKFVIVQPGPLPKANIVRYTVYKGVEGPRTELPLPITVQADMLYRVVVTAQGDRFTTSVNGQMVDQWSDDRLLSGGVGFFSDRESQSRVKWVRVVDKDDFLGWVCSQLLPRTDDSKGAGENSRP